MDIVALKLSLRKMSIAAQTLVHSCAAYSVQLYLDAEN